MADSKERRAEERFPFSASTSCAFAAPVGPEITSAKLRDVSMDGLGIVLGKSVEIGSLLVLSLTNQSKSFFKMVTVKVTHVTPIHGGFLIGGNFTAPITYQELSTLVM